MSSAPRIGSLCTGYGGLDMAALAVFGGEPAWVADPDPGAQAILAHHYPDVPNLGDITTTDWASVPPVDVLTTGFPCQDISYAGRGAGIKEGTRSGLWSTVVEAARLLRPGYLLAENVSGIVARRPGLDVVLADLARIGFDAQWCCVRASDIGAPHRRNRWFLLAWPAHTAGPRLEAGRQGRPRGRATAHPANLRHQRDRAAWDGRYGPAHRDHPASHAPSLRRREGRTEPAGEQRGPDAAKCGGADWGAYAGAIARWERVTGRAAPSPTEPGRTGPRLSPVFVEWLMGLPAGHVTQVPGLARNQQLHALGNGVVPAQGSAALADLLSHSTPQQERSTA